MNTSYSPIIINQTKETLYTRAESLSSQYDYSPIQNIVFDWSDIVILEPTIYLEFNDVFGRCITDSIEILNGGFDFQFKYIPFKYKNNIFIKY